jgi:hydroxymethylglutaryl-CoA lyase
MGFGNPYGDPYSEDLVSQFADILITLGSDVISLADTIGIADSAAIQSLFKGVSIQFPEAMIGVHLHSTSDTSRAKVQAALRGGCRRFDGALRGFGGCPMAKDELVGNIATETIVSCLEDEDAELNLDKASFSEAMVMANQVFAT